MRQIDLALTVLILAALGPATLAAAAAISRRLRVLRARLATVQAGRDAARADLAATERLLRLAANDIRTPAMALLGHAEALEAADDVRASAQAIAAIAEQLLGIADEVQDHTLAPHPRVLRREPLSLGQAVADAVAAVEATLGPGHRVWRVAAEIEALRLDADRRALHQVLTRVLGNAARLSHAGDCIEISCTTGPAGLTLTIADEGAGLCGLDPAWAPEQTDTRGLGLGLSLARALMAAHGGSLAVESAARVGTRVALHFPSVGAVREALLAA